MAGADRSIRLLCATFTGTPPGDDDWQEVLHTANRAWLSPALHVALAHQGRLHEVPEAVRDYIAFLHERNLARNQKLREQLLEAAHTLNAEGIRPIVLKGANDLLPSDPADLGFRMISDVDLSVAPSQVEPARAALAEIGYHPTFRSNELARSSDAGTLELHSQPSGRSAVYLTGDLRESSSPVEVEGAMLLIPLPTARALHLIVHDMIKDGDLWRLRIDLRHLLDLYRLASTTPGIEWDRLRATLHGKTGSRALAVEAAALNRLFQVPVPEDLLSRGARLQHTAAIVAAGDTVAGAMVRTAGNLAWGFERMASTYRWRGLRDFWWRVRQTLSAPAGGSRL